VLLDLDGDTMTGGIKVVKQCITVRSRKLRATWSVESMKDLMMAHGDGLYWFFRKDIIWHEILPNNTIED
jgi:hypothetical protein